LITERLPDIYFVIYRVGGFILQTWLLRAKKQSIRLMTIILVLVLPVVYLALKAHAKPLSENVSRNCPLTTPLAWQRFLEESADNEKWVETCEDSTCDKGYYDHVTKWVKGVLDSCQSVIVSNPKIAMCTANLRKFTPAWMRQHDAVSYGFNVDNATYLSEQDAEDKPEGMMKIPEAIVNALPDQARVQDVARQHGYKYLTHDSALKGVRTFILVQDPQQRFDQWLILNLRGPGEKKIAKGMPVSILAVQKKNARGEPLEKVVLHFRDYAIEEVGSGVRLSVNEQGNGKCYSCHASGMRQLIPRRTATLEAQPVFGEPLFNKPVPSDFAYRRLNAFNKIIRRYGANDWDNKIDPTEHGPMLGAKQGCIACHNGTTRGPLTVSTSPSQLQRKVFTELSMPPTRNWINLLEKSEMNRPLMTAEEEKELKKAYHLNHALTAAFLQSRLPELKKWLLESSCL
jgi:hypothetical protein